MVADVVDDICRSDAAILAALNAEWVLAKELKPLLSPASMAVERARSARPLLRVIRAWLGIAAVSLGTAKDNHITLPVSRGQAASP